MKNVKVKSSTRKGTIKVKLILIPLVLVLIAIAVLGVISSFTMRTSFLKEMEENGFDSSEKFIHRIEDNAKSLESINGMLDDKISMVAKTVLRYENTLNNEIIKNIAADSGVEEVNFYNEEGSIIYTNIDEYIGWTPEDGHPAREFLLSSDTELTEEVRKV